MGVAIPHRIGINVDEPLLVDPFLILCCVNGGLNFDKSKQGIKALGCDSSLAAWLVLEPSLWCPGQYIMATKYGRFTEFSNCKISSDV